MALPNQTTKTGSDVEKKLAMCADVRNTFAFQKFSAFEFAVMITVAAAYFESCLFLSPHNLSKTEKIKNILCLHTAKTCGSKKSVQENRFELSTDDCNSKMRQQKFALL